MKTTEKQSFEHIAQKQPFSVPKDYFEQVHAQIMSKIPEQKNSRIQKQPTRKIILSWSIAAAIFVGVLIGVKDIFFTHTPSQMEAFEQRAEFASTEDYDFYLFLQEDAARKEISSEYYHEP